MVSAMQTSSAPSPKNCSASATARARGKRGGPGARQVPLDRVLASFEERRLDVLALKDVADDENAMKRIEGLIPRGMIFWGPPGTGKTTLARVLAAHTRAEFITLSAVLAGIKEIREAVERARHAVAAGRRAILFVDEVHRWNRAQQDALLPHVEDGTVTLIGATTENPSFELNNAMLSRARVYVLRPLTEADMLGLIERALTDSERGLGSLKLSFPPELRTTLAAMADGDARRLLGLLELAADIAPDGVIDEAVLRELAGESWRRFDKGGEAFYDQISALHKAVRGSAPDAALYWLARMLDGGCEPLYIARRVLRMASEVIGLADPRALTLALDACDTYERLGSPEGELAIAEVVTYLACAPKSNAAYNAINAAQQAGMANAFKFSAVLGAVMGAFCFLLPATPPKQGKQANATLEALTEVTRQPLLTLFLLAVPVSCIHQFYFVHTSAFVGAYQAKAEGFTRWVNAFFGVGGGGLMTIGQMSEMLVLAAIPFVSKKLPRKALLAVGLAAYGLRMALFAYASALPESLQLTAIILGIAMHGLCFGCFIFVAFMVVDEETTGDVRASAQSLFNLVIVGVGIIVGSFIAGRVGAYATVEGKTDYTRLFSIPMWASVACLLALLAAYPNRRRAPAAAA